VPYLPTGAQAAAALAKSEALAQKASRKAQEARLVKDQVGEAVGVEGSQ
jgi:hypothetical protein